MPFNLGLITEKDDIPITTASNPTRPLAVLWVSNCDQINNLVPRGRQRTKSSGEEAPLKMYKLEMILRSPMPQNFVSASNYTPIEHEDTDTQRNAKGKVSEYLNG